MTADTAPGRRDAKRRARQQADAPERALHRDADLWHRPDFALYATPATLAQRAGVPPRDLLALCVKELVDNACDITDATGADPADVEAAIAGMGGVTVSDLAGGIPGTEDDILALFRLDRPLSSSKLLPAPTRGCIGNGLRVVVGLAAATGGTITVHTGSLFLRLRPTTRGTVDVLHRTDDAPPLAGTSITLSPGWHRDIGRDPDPLRFARPALEAVRATTAPAWRGPTPPAWIAPERWLELMRYAPPAMTARQLVAKLAGCSGSVKSGQITRDVRGRTCRSMTEAEALAVLRAAQAASKAPLAKALAPIGEELHPDAQGYATEAETDAAGRPVRAEAWAWVVHFTQARHGDAALLVNRTRPPTHDLYLAPAAGPRAAVGVFGCGLGERLDCPGGTYRVALAITAPVVPVVSDAKVPDLAPWSGIIARTLALAIKRARKEAPRPTQEPKGPKPHRVTQRDVVLENLPRAIDESGSGGAFRFNLRSLFYRVRDAVQQATGSALDYGYFADVITDYENEHGEVPSLWRNARGSFREPHNGEAGALGTLAVETYARPRWRFANLLVCEKEDSLPILTEAGFGDRWDCLLVSSSGMITRALRDLVDKVAMNAEAEPVRVFVMHDADAAGGIIAETLVRETKARGARKVAVTDLGLFPWVAVADGLPVEKIGEPAKPRPVAALVRDHDAQHGTAWAEWLQRHRVELSAMTSRALVAWLDRRLAEEGARRVSPPDDVLAWTFAASVRAEAAEDITAEVMRRVRPIIARRLAARLAKVKAPEPAAIREAIAERQRAKPEAPWTAGVGALVARALRE